MASPICDSTKPPSSITRDETPLSSLSNWVDKCLSAIISLSLNALLSLANGEEANPSTEPARDVVLGFLALRFEEDVFRDAELHQIAEVHVRGVITATCRLLHVVGDDDHGVIVFQF